MLVYCYNSSSIEYLELLCYIILEGVVYMIVYIDGVTFCYFWCCVRLVYCFFVIGIFGLRVWVIEF